MGEDRPQPACARSDPRDRRLRGARTAGCACGADAGRRPRPEDLRARVRRPAGPRQRTRPLLRRAGGRRRGRGARAGAPRSGRGARGVRAARAGGRPRAGDGDGAAPPRPPHDGARLPRGPEAERRASAGDRARRPRRSWGRRGLGLLRGRAAGSGVPRPGVGDRDPGRRGRRRHPRRHAVAARRSRAGRALPRSRARAGAHPPRGRGRRVRRPRGPLDAAPRGAPRSPGRAPREDGLQPRGVVRRPHPPPSCADLGRASRDARGEAHRGPDADPRRRRRLRLELDRGHLERVLVRGRPVRGGERADRRPRRVHEQPAVRGDARLRRGADVLRRGGADGPAGGRARHRPGRAPPPERARDGRRCSRPARSSRGRCRRAR